MVRKSKISGWSKCKINVKKSQEGNRDEGKRKRDEKERKGERKTGITDHMTRNRREE